MQDAGSKLEKFLVQAQEVLMDLGMDKERFNERSARTLLSLAHMDAESSWADATNDMYTMRRLMDWMRDRLGQDYAPNTRETIRRFTLHQFCVGAIVEQNADRPDRPINSPKWNYRLNPNLIPVLHAVGTDDYELRIAEFLGGVETWRQQQAEIRMMNKVPVELPDGTGVMLSAGGQNVLIKDMVEEFCPRYAPGGQVLYIDDADHSFRTQQEALMASVGIELPEHGKVPDLIVWMADKEWLFLMEACSTHGPIDVMRKCELVDLFASRKSRLVFVSCFPDRMVMRQYLADLAWETEAWCASDPDHIIHLDGERFMGPYSYGVVEPDE
ncbi:BsuBI/PstI family type II restriction endonuclease [Adlercreutzia sp. ZJ138]|uniref:BsuBI/PstI family type II restriction endonuclease n=1 Tax=Adlercreutzia sp. ZJ138 TaxID=2709405 RepID=UPI0013E9FB50|nr:BsuBI/PstI family type II restriction endonuclease [Adlercreutzia sp. ZJ138]